VAAIEESVVAKEKQQGELSFANPALRDRVGSVNRRELAVMQVTRP
jgi:hypothetical protein